MKFLKVLLGYGLAAALTSSALAAAATKPIKLSASSPKARSLQGLLQDDGWHLTFRLRSDTASDYFEVRERFEGGSDFDLLVVDNPDDCLDLSHTGTINGAFEAGCPGGADEKFVTFNPSSAAHPQLPDTRFCGAPFVDDMKDTPVTDLVSQGGTVPFTESTKSYYFSQFFGGLFRPTGPTTEFDPTIPDCYGYGTDEDLPSLVIMADAGGAKVFDTDLNFDNSRIRNMGGLVTSVGYELLNRNDVTAIVATLYVTNGMLEPQIFVDLGANTIAGGAPFTDPEFKYRVDAGPLQTVALTGSFDSPAFLQAIQEEVGSQTTVKVRAVVVQGPGPAFIDDLDGNGKFNRRDLELAGYETLSNTSVTTLQLIAREALRTEEDSYECPTNLLYTDLDGDGQAAGCLDGDGTSRSALRVPR
jgi:hypothetical protein